MAQATKETQHLIVWESTSHGHDNIFYKLYIEACRRQNDRMRQALVNNLWGNNPGELERWADDGGYQP